MTGGGEYRQRVTFTIEAEVRADMVATDYGVPGSPELLEPVNGSVHEIEVNGRAVDERGLGWLIGEQGADQILDALVRATDDDR